MKTKNLIMFMMLALCISSCTSPYDENNAKTLITTKTPKCINVVQIYVNSFSGVSYYSAVDSSYIQHIFRVTSSGVVVVFDPKK